MTWAGQKMRIPADMNRTAGIGALLVRISARFFLILAVCSWPSLVSSGAGPATAPRTVSPIELTVETLEIGTNGTVTVSTDGALVLPGRGAHLEKERGYTDACFAPVVGVLRKEVVAYLEQMGEERTERAKGLLDKNRRNEAIRSLVGHGKIKAFDDWLWWTDEW